MLGLGLLLAVTVAIVLALRRPVALIDLGAEVPQALGLKVRAVQTGMLALAALLADPSVSAKFGSSVLWHRRPADGSPGVDIALENGFPQARAALLAGDRVLVRSARLQVRTEPLAESTARAKSMTETRQATADAVAALAPPGSGLDATLQFEAFIFFEADVILPTSTYTSLGLGAAAIAIVTLVLLPHLAAVLVVVVAVASIDVMLLGSMPLFGIKLNTVSGESLRPIAAGRAPPAAIGPASSAPASVSCDLLARRALRLVPL